MWYSRGSHVGVVMQCDLVLHVVGRVCISIVVGVWLLCCYCVVIVVLGVMRVIPVVVVWFACGKIMFGDVVARQH